MPAAKRYIERMAARSRAMEGKTILQPRTPGLRSPCRTFSLRLGECPMATNIFLLLDSLGLVFLIYALANFWTEGDGISTATAGRFRWARKLSGTGCRHSVGSSATQQWQLGDSISGAYRQIHGAPQQRRQVRHHRNAQAGGAANESGPHRQITVYRAHSATKGTPGCWTQFLQSLRLYFSDCPYCT